ncbi:MAG: hypothetical protein JO166_04935 [Deltaproteobacteria bacterium]|nr:hypothetical protein [Deltaproteobacteria bacterium]
MPTLLPRDQRYVRAEGAGLLFQDLKQRLMRHIKSYPVILGGAAWLTETLRFKGAGKSRASNDRGQQGRRCATRH